MSRTRFELTINVTTASPLHSGGIDEEVDRSASTQDRKYTPRGFARRGVKHPVLTGRSIKGAVRAACQDLAVTDPDLWSDIANLWGGIEEAASLTFHSIEIPEDRISQRPGIAVDRYWGTAADTALFAHEILPSGNPLTLRITGESRDEEHLERIRKLLSLILALFKAERVVLGGRKNAGWGRVTLAHPDEGSGSDPWEYSEYALDSRDALIEWLSERPTATKIEPLDGAFPTPIRVTIGWESPTGILVAEARRETNNEPEGSEDAASTRSESEAQVSKESDTQRLSLPTSSTTMSASPKPGPRPAPLPGKAEAEKHARKKDKEEKKPEPTRGFKDTPQALNDEDAYREAYDKLPLVLPGSSIRGVLRSRASRIARTILAQRAAQGNAEAQKAWSKVSDWSNTGIHSQLAEDLPLVQDLFGSTEQSGAVSVFDCETCETNERLDSETNEALDCETYEPFDSETRKSAEPLTITHNAGDRWTGGVADGALFSEEIYPKAQWKPLVLEFNPERMKSKDKNRQHAAWCLLGLVLAELATGSLPLGSRSTRGLGAVRVCGIRIEGGPLGFLSEEPIVIHPKHDAQSEKSVGDHGAQIAGMLLEHLRSIHIEPNSCAGEDWKGWSSYLIEPSSSERSKS
ncbi:RAMP superfamily CRISPR-associated protein [Schaalia cardiffensis]